MRSFVPTPFDDLIWRCLQSQLENPAYPSNNVFLIFLGQHLKILRRCYINLLQARVPPFNREEWLKQEKQGDRTLTREEMVSMSDTTLGITLAYFDYLSSINQFGRVLQKKFPGQKMPPLYDRIRFFRNKVAEHWDDYYIEFAKSAGLTQSGSSIPSMMPIARDYSFGATETARKIFEQEIQKAIPEFKLPVTYDYEINAEIIYEILEKAYPNYPDRRKLPPEIVNYLFGVGFPLPFYNTEKYTDNLIGYFEKLIDPKVT